MTTTADVERPGSEVLLSVRQVAERLNVSTGTVHRLIRRRDLGHVRIGERTIRIADSALQDYLERCTVRRLR